MPINLPSRYLSAKYIGRIASGCLAILLACILLIPTHALAHVLVVDPDANAGAILHITPDDDPVAGEDTGIYYELQTSTNLNGAATNFIVRSDSGGIEESVGATLVGRTVASHFTFPVRGLYFLDLIISPQQGQSMIFHSSVRVTHSKTGNDPAPVVPDWAREGLIVCAWAMAFLAATAFKRRKKIAQVSK